MTETKKLWLPAIPFRHVRRLRLAGPLVPPSSGMEQWCFDPNCRNLTLDHYKTRRQLRPASRRPRLSRAAKPKAPTVVTLRTARRLNYLEGRGLVAPFRCPLLIAPYDYRKHNRDGSVTTERVDDGSPTHASC